MGQSLISDRNPLRNEKMREEVDKILLHCKEHTRAFLEKHRPELELLRDALIERDELTGDEFRLLLFENGFIDKPPSNMVPLPIMPPAQQAAN